jgi:hypothetical protein
MATKKGGGKGKAKTDPERDKAEKRFKIAMLNLEKVTQERMLIASDPFSAGLKMAREIRSLAERIEKEVESVTVTSTEAGNTGYDVIGVGVGVL